MMSGLIPGKLNALPEQHAICFDGSRLYFSETLLAAVARELTDHAIIRAGEFDCFRHNDVDLALVGPDRAADFDGVVTDLTSIFPKARLVFCYEDEDKGRALFREHAARITSSRMSLMPLNVRLEAWISYMRLFLLGQSHICTDLLRSNEAKDRAVQHPSTSPALQSLTRREAQILTLAAQGEQNKIIAAHLNISEHTVKLHMHRVIRKLGVRNRTEAARYLLSSVR